MSNEPETPRRILRLTLKKKWFDMVASGQKREEYREPKQWIFSRLIGKDYDLVEFSNGYGKQVPRILVTFLGWNQGPGNPKWGAIQGRNYVIIRLGEVLETKNLTTTEP